VAQFESNRPASCTNVITLCHHGDVPQRDPVRKKILDYVHGTRNTYGNSPQAARNAVPRRKALENRKVRHGVKRVIDPRDVEGTDERMEGAQDSQQAWSWWRKVPDAPLAEWLERPTKGRPGGRAGGPSKPSPLRAEALRRLLRKRGS
jgi:hypothetical protein